MIHEGLSKIRLHPAADNDREVSFAEQWKDQNSGMCHTLLYLIPDCTERDATVAATIIQWLGSNVGMAFLREVISSNENVRNNLTGNALLRSPG